jgi:hypothetical protein
MGQSGPSQPSKATDVQHSAFAGTKENWGNVQPGASEGTETNWGPGLEGATKTISGRAARWAVAAGGSIGNGVDDMMDVVTAID